MKDKKRWLSDISIYVAIIIGILSFIYSILDAFNVFDASWLADRGQNLILLNLSAASVFLVSNYMDSIRRIETSIPKMEEDIERRLSQAFQIAGYRFNSIQELEEFQIKEMKKATSEILDLSWSNKISSRHTSQKDKKLDNTYDELISSLSKKIDYKEIFIFNTDGRKEKLKRRIEENSVAYSSGYFNESEIPQFQFVVIDRRTVIFASSRYKMPLAVVDDNMGVLFANYYELLWDASKKIKTGSTIDNEVYKKIIDQEGL